jgi:ABC-type phosphonate transport system ATPase subunit
MFVENLVASYAPELEPALKSISFDARPGEKIGVVCTIFTLILNSISDPFFSVFRSDGRVGLFFS